MIREYRNRENVIGSGFQSCPPNDRFLLTIAGEIVYYSVPNNEKKRYYLTTELIINNDKFEINYEKFKHEMSVDEYLDCFPMSATSQVSKSMFSSKKKAYLAGFNFPINFELISNFAMKWEELDTQQNHDLIMFFEVFSIDSSNVNRFEGFGSCRVPVEPGHYELEVKICREMMSGFEELKRELIGCFSPIGNKQHLIKMQEQGEFAQNYSNSVLVGSGLLLLRLNVCVFADAIKKLGRLIYERTKIANEIAQEYQKTNPKK